MVGVRNPMPGVVYPSSEDLRYYLEHGALTEETLVEALMDMFARHGDHPAVSEPGITITHRELDEITDRAASAFIKLGLRPLDRVVFQIANCKELLFGFIGCLKAGLIPICTLAAHRRQEIGYLGRHAGAKAHIVRGDDPKFDFVQFALDMRQEIPTMAHTIVMRAPRPHDGDNVHDFANLILAEDAEEAHALVRGMERDPYQVAVFQLSGGTSGVPKIIPRFQNEYLYTMRAYAKWHGHDERMVAYTPNPMLHNAPMICYWGPVLLCGGEVAISPSLDINVIAEIVRTRRPTWYCIPPVILNRLIAAGLFDREIFSSARGCKVSNSAPKYRAVTGTPAYHLYGMTEGLIVSCRKGDPAEVLAGTVGRPISELDQIRIVTPGTEDDVRPGDVGELIYKGPCTTRGYYDAADRNKEAFTSDGFFRSGDLMREHLIEGQRYISFEGRVKDVVSRGGEKINCEEVERVAVGHPAIAQIAIVAMPDPDYGERACAFVIPKPSQAGLSVAELGAYLEREGLAKFKWPERIEIVSEFPLTASGKLSKPLLREMITRKVKDEAERTAVHSPRSAGADGPRVVELR
jgi:non-ribosomal peptide synthetase component E (peptide arylation enzyme)